MLLTDLVRARSTGSRDDDAVVQFTGHPPHRHGCPQLVHVAAGSGVLDTGDERFALADGEGVWVPTGWEHALELVPGSIALGPMVPGAEPPGHRPRAVADRGVRRLLTTLLGVAPTSPADVAVFRAALERELTTAAGAHFPLVLPVHPAARAVARDAVRSSATLEVLAGRQYVSARQVRRLFLDQTGLPFTTWRTRARLNAAVERLRAGAGWPAARTASGFATREGLVKALARETGSPASRVLTDVGIDAAR